METSRLAYVWIMGAALVLFLCGQIRQEFDPVAGHWEVAAVTEGGVRTAAPACRIFLKASTRGDATFADYWTCGVPAETFGEGKVVRDERGFALYRENWATGERDAAPNCRFDWLPHGRLAATLPGEHGPIQLEMRRTENAQTAFDLLGLR